MNCEWVERQLSAYHDSALDADIATQVKNHLASCTRCDAVLDDFTRFDKAVASLPRVAPRPELRARIFASPEFQAILHNTQTTPAEKHAGTTPLVGTTRPHLLRAIAQIAAIVVLLVGAGVLITNIAAHSRHGGLIFAICPQLSSGTHLVYRSGGTLHSGNANVVCDTQVRVGALWQVSPDGQWIAYVNETTGAVRIVRSDATGDHSVATGDGTVVALAWAPAGAHLGIITHSAGDDYRVALAAPTSTSAEQYGTFQATQTPQALTWAPDGASLVWTFADTADANHPQTPHIGTLSIPGHRVASSPVAGLVADGLFNPTGAEYPTYMTYAYGHDAIVTAIGSEGFNTDSGSVGTPLSVAVNNAKAVAFSRALGKWAVAQSDGTIATVDALTGKTTPLAHITNVTQLTWSPTGTYLTATSGTTLWLITPTGVKRLVTNVSAVTPTWGQRDDQLGFIANGIVTTVNVSTGATDALTPPPTTTPIGLVWSPDGQLVTWNDQGFTIAGVTTATLLTEAPQWSVAG